MESKAKRGRGRPRKARIGETLFIPVAVLDAVKAILNDFREKHGMRSRGSSVASTEDGKKSQS
jgi:hypothetical protein